MKFVSSISSLPISAQSAAFAPTNSADVSAIASAYQVVSATATQLYAGTAYVTSVNGAPVSASRAGQAANASLASSAYYDGTGRLISSLPDSDTVSAIASAYAESAASGKQDELTFGYDDDKISAINGSALAGQGGGGMITSIQSALDPWYQTSISGLNGSSLYPKWAESAKSARTAATADWAWNAQSASAAPTAWASSFITGVSSPSGTIRVLGGTAIESTNSAVIPSTVIEGFYTAYAGGTTVGPNSKLHCVLPTANPSTEIIMPFLYNPGLVLWSSDNGIEGSQEKDISPETITAQVPNATAVDIWSDSWIEVNSVTASAATQEIGGGVGELAWASALPTYSYDAENKISGINGSAIAGGAGGVDSATVSAIASSYAESAASGKLDSSASSSFYSTSNPSGFITGVDLSPYQTTADMSGYMPTSLSSDFQQVTGMSSYVPYSSIGYNTASAISGINGSALAGTTYSAGTGIDITDDEISVDYDTNTLDVVGQTVTENVTQKSSSGLFLLPSSVAALLSQQGNTQVTVHIPANTLKDENFLIDTVGEVTYRLTLYATDSTSESSVSLFSTPIEYTLDVDQAVFTEQDVVFNLPASVANQWSQNLSSAAAFSICGQKYSAPVTGATLTVIGDLTTSPITFTFADASATKLAVKNPLPSSTSADEGKCLVVDSNGDPEWGTGGKVYTGTDGVVVDNVNDTVGLEAPVDIVAGPGIVIDNPDGNTLRVSQSDPTVDVVRDCENWNGHSMKSIILRGGYTTNTSMQNQYIDNVLPVGTTIAFIDGSNSYVVYGGNPQINMMVPYCIDNNRLFSPWLDITNRRLNLRYIDVTNNVNCTYYLCVKYAVD